MKEDVTNPLEGVTYDTSEKTVTITVTKANGELKAEVDSEPSFKNVFNYTYANFKVKKTLTGDTPTNAGEFKFELTAVSTTANVAEVPMPAGSNADKKEVSVNGAGEVEFGKIEYKAVGKYVYKVVEVNTNLSNYTYDQAEYTVTVDVTTDADNKLVSTYEIKKGTEVVTDLEFTNKYETPVAPVAPVTPASLRQVIAQQYDAHVWHASSFCGINVSGCRLQETITLNKISIHTCMLYACMN